LGLQEVVKLECNTLLLSQIGNGHVDLLGVLVEGEGSLVVVWQESGLFEASVLLWHVLGQWHFWPWKIVAFALRLDPVARGVWEVWPRVVWVSKVESLGEI